MATSINLGSLYTTGNKTVFGGSASGLDTESLVKGLVEAKSIPKTKAQDKIDKNTEVLGALSELQTKLTNLRRAVDGLRNPPGVANESAKFFDYRTSILTTNTSSAAADFVSITTGAGAPLGATEITVGQLARAQVQTTSTGFASQSDPIVAAAGDATPGTISAGTITLDTPTTNPVNITIQEDDSLIDVAARFNAVKNQTGVEASILKVADNDYRLVLKSNKTGEDHGFTIGDPDGVLSDIGFTTQTALNAEFTIDGLQLVRQSNIVTDAIKNTTITLKQTTTATNTTVTVSTQADTDFVKSGIIDFIDTFNDFKIFIAKQTLLNEDGSPAEGALLTDSSLVDTILNRANAEVTQIVSGLGEDALKSLQDIGITLTDYAGDAENPEVKNILTYDDAKLSAALAGNFDEVRGIFEFTFTADSTDISLFARSNALAVTKFNLEIDTTTKKAYARDVTTNDLIAELDYDDSTGSVLLTGKDGTALQGLKLLYTSEDSATISINVSQGVADRLYNAMDDVLKRDTGLLDVEVASIGDENFDLEEDITDLNEEIERYREKLLDQFARLESLISSVNQLLSALDAQDQARNSS